MVVVADAHAACMNTWFSQLPVPVCGYSGYGSGYVIV